MTAEGGLVSSRYTTFVMLLFVTFTAAVIVLPDDSGPKLASSKSSSPRFGAGLS
jgi:hypothetical protein